MAKRMLMDATHAEEVRVAIVQDQRLIDLDIETASREQIKGNIYLARVTRVEPALQAAFVEFKGGRQGFLSINDIHSKYYPSEDSERDGKAPQPPPPSPPSSHAQVAEESAGSSHEAEGSATVADSASGETQILLPDEDDPDADELPPVEELRARPRRRHLPIQRILTRGQTLLVQVAKEARGTKGASLTTHISLAGRYTVLLPENSGGGGISRKIMDPVERKHLKGILSTMEVSNHVSLIIRTAGLGRTKREISRDMSYLLRLWKMIDEKAKASKPPALIHEEGDLIIRTIRDLYTTDMEEILIEGQNGYRIGKDFMRLLMPRYVKVVQPYKDSLPIFARYQIENQIESMHERKVPLRSGGSLVIDPTEALVSIDINSGRSTREKDVETTAFKTNIQAAEEIGRQLRLRDLGGLIVIDFIDMDDRKHVTEVEKQLKDALKLDRAKIQVGRISQFGLLELSRQRMKPTFSETNRLECPRCKGLGTIRSVESASVHLFRQLEEETSKGRYSTLTYTTSQEVANYLLNNKRAQIQTMENTHGTMIALYGDPSLQTPEFHKNRIEWTREELQEREAHVSKEPVVEKPEEDFEDSSPEILDEEHHPEQEEKREPKGRRGRRVRKEGKARTERGPAGQSDAVSKTDEPAQERTEPASGGTPASRETRGQQAGSPRVEEKTASGERTRRRRRRRKKSGSVTEPSAGGNRPPVQTTPVDFHLDSSDAVSGQDETGQDETGQDNTGQDNTGQDQTGQDQTGQDQTGQDQTGQDQTGQDQTGQDQTGQDQTGQSETGQDQTGQDQTGQDQTGQSEAGQDQTGQSEAGQDQTGQSETGQDQTGKDKTRKDKTRKDKTKQPEAGQPETRQDKTNRQEAEGGEQVSETSVKASSTATEEAVATHVPGLYTISPGTHPDQKPVEGGQKTVASDETSHSVAETSPAADRALENKKASKNTRGGRKAPVVGATKTAGSVESVPAERPKRRRRRKATVPGLPRTEGTPVVSGQEGESVSASKGVVSAASEEGFSKGKASASSEGGSSKGKASASSEGGSSKGTVPDTSEAGVTGRE